MSKPPIVVRGMNGMGDCLHQRAIMRQLLRTNDVFLQSSWASMYHDLIAEGLKITRNNSGLRTQMKNVERENAKFYRGPIPRGAATIQMRYAGTIVAQTRSRTILEAMCIPARANYAEADFRLPIPYEWQYPADELIASWHATKPLLVYRPLVIRTEWKGNAKRNPDPRAYAELFAVIRDSFFVVSVADLQDGREWAIGPQLKADVTIHDGSLPFETLAALFSRAKLVYTPSGFGVVLAQAVETPVISVIGNYESAAHHAAGARWSPYLGIEPITPCACQLSTCLRPCSKAINIPAARSAIVEFVQRFDIVGNVNQFRPWEEMFTAVQTPPPRPQQHSGIKA